MFTFVLIEADEGTTDAIFVCHGDTLDTLKHYVAQVLERRIQQWPGPWSEGNQGYMLQEKNALLAMFEAKSPTSPGRYDLDPLEPIWRDWTLLVVDEHGTFHDC